jgi:gamma-glutamylcyclotransferase (GGCT)/AIG2-like uncharacterized protein YtfP
LFLFVYGSLRYGMTYHDYLEGATQIAAHAWTWGELYDTREGYPGLVSGEGQVLGEVYQITCQQLKRINDLEDYYGPSDPRNIYERKQIEINSETGTFLSYVYFFKDEDFLRSYGIPISTGDWVEYIRSFEG